jgi:hypothetical protein
MHAVWIVIVCLVAAAVGCGGSDVPSPTAAPSVLPPRPIAPPPSAIVPVPAGGIPIGVGEVVVSRVMPEDPLCDPAWPYRCRYFRVTAPTDGLMEVIMRCPVLAVRYVVDLGVIDTEGRAWFGQPQFVLGPQRSVTLRVAAGATYFVEIWSVDAPGEEFEVRTSIRAK